MIRVWKWVEDFAFLWNGKEMFYRHYWLSDAPRYRREKPCPWIRKMEGKWTPERLEEETDAIEVFGSEKYAEIERFVIDGSK